MIICYFKLRHKQAWFFGAWNNMYALRRPCFMQAGIGKHVTSHETHTWLERWDPKLNSITQTSFGAGLFPLHLQTEILSCICFDFPISEEISLSWLCVGSSGALSWASWKFCAVVIVVAISSLQRDPRRAGLFPLTVQVNAKSSGESMGISHDCLPCESF